MSVSAISPLQLMIINPFALLSEEEFEELDHFLLYDVDTEEDMAIDMVGLYASLRVRRSR